MISPTDMKKLLVLTTVFLINIASIKEVNADVIEIWTDVDGVMTADPRKVKGAFTQQSMTYAEAMEMSHFGAKVIYPPTIIPALQQNIPLRIRNTFNPNFAGTLISEYHEMNDSVVKGISSIGDVSLLTL